MLLLGVPLFAGRNRIKRAIDRGVKVQLIIDGKVNQKKNKKGKLQESFPREDNLKTIHDAKNSKSNVILREAKPNNIRTQQIHGAVERRRKVPAGSMDRLHQYFRRWKIHGQTNVGHWVSNKDVAEEFRAYWSS